MESWKPTTTVINQNSQDAAVDTGVAQTVLHRPLTLIYDLDFNPRFPASHGHYSLSVHMHNEKVIRQFVFQKLEWKQRTDEWTLPIALPVPRALKRSVIDTHRSSHCHTQSIVMILLGRIRCVAC